MDPTEGRVARPEQRRGCRRGTPQCLPKSVQVVQRISAN